MEGPLGFVALLLLASEIAKCIARGCLLLFYKNYNNIYCYYCDGKVCMCIPSFIVIGYCVSVSHGHVCRYCNVLPEAVYCCFTGTTLFTKLFTCPYDQSLRFLSRLCYVTLGF